MSKPVQVMKFGGTSVGDAACIARVARILSEASRRGPVVAVVSAMSGVTNKLIQAASESEIGDTDAAQTVFDALRKQHDAALSALIKSDARRAQIAAPMAEIFSEGERLCKGTALLRELTPRTLDSISSLGERLSAPMVAGALRELGARSEAVEATELIVTDPYHGGADPIMDRTRRQCEARLRPMLQEGMIPVVTGFIGATIEGVLTTLGRGGSDYSATILGAAIERGRNHYLDRRRRRADRRSAPGCRRAHHSGNFLSRSHRAGLLRRESAASQNAARGRQAGHPGLDSQQLSSRTASAPKSRRRAAPMAAA